LDCEIIFFIDNLIIEMTRKKTFQGFTLVELMVAVAIIAILAFVAYPAYQSQVKKTRRSDAQAALAELSALQEEYRYQTGGYATSIDSLDLKENGFEKKDCKGKNIADFRSKECYYTLSVSARAEAGFTLRARAADGQAADIECLEFSIDDLGDKKATSDNCWY
jgi:type IV pilus assembly protein PilE